MKNQTSDEVEVLGVVVYGTKEELIPVMNRSYVRAVSLGGMIDNY